MTLKGLQGTPPLYGEDAQRFLDEVERMKDVPAPPAPTPNLERARKIAIEKWGRKCGN